MRFFAVLAALALPVAAGSGLGSKSATIALGASLSGAVDLGGNVPVTIVMPAAWDAANLTFQCSADGTTFSNLYDAMGNEYTVTAAAARVIILTPADFAGCRAIKVRSGAAGAAVAQTAARALVVGVRGW